MIISASRRTDIPAYYAEWLMNRIKEGYVLVRNPMNARQIRRVSLSRQDVDGFVFWSKNPAPMLPFLPMISDYPYYFQFTLNAYDTDVETNAALRDEVVIPAFFRLSELIGPERVIWRYDPVLINRRYTADYHIAQFGALASRLRGYTKKVTFSFMDMYRKIEKRIKPLELLPMPDDLKDEIAAQFCRIAAENGMEITVCAEERDYRRFGALPACCVDRDILERQAGHPIRARKDRYQRKECGCRESVDIGAYHTCTGGCLYCYANFGSEVVGRKREMYRVDSPMLCDREDL